MLSLYNFFYLLIKQSCPVRDVTPPKMKIGLFDSEPIFEIKFLHEAECLAARVLRLFGLKDPRSKHSAQWLYYFTVVASPGFTPLHRSSLGSIQGRTFSAGITTVGPK
jgi:hypothetical protein